MQFVKDVHSEHLFGHSNFEMNYYSLQSQVGFLLSNKPGGHLQIGASIRSPLQVKQVESELWQVVH